MCVHMTGSIGTVSLGVVGPVVQSIAHFDQVLDLVSFMYSLQAFIFRLMVSSGWGSQMVPCWELEFKVSG